MEIKFFKDIIQEHRKKKKLSLTQNQIPVEILTPFGRVSEDVNSVL